MIDNKAPGGPVVLGEQLVGEMRRLNNPAYNIVKTSGGAAAYDAGAVSTEVLAGDGYVEVTPTIASLSRGFGFAADDPDQNFNTVDYLFLLDGATVLAVYENGSSKYSGTYAINDVLVVRRTGTTITYEKNGAAVYTSLTASSGNILVDTTLRHTNAVLHRVKLFDGTRQIPITWTTVTNVTITQV
jgi:hypothetical protein